MAEFLEELLHEEPRLTGHNVLGPARFPKFAGGSASLHLMAHDPIDTLGKARHNMLVKAECSCGNVRYCRSAVLMMVYGGGFDPPKLEFDCSRCKPEIKVTLLEVHTEPQLFIRF